MFRSLAATLVSLVLCSAPGAAGDLAVLARQGRWATILEIAQRRESQLPVTGAQAMVAAEAARHQGRTGLRRHYLTAVLEDDVLRPVARIELAEMVVPADPKRAVELLLPVLGHGASRELRAAAIRVASQAVHAGVSSKLRGRLHAELRRIPRSSRRPLEVELALTGPQPRRHLQRILDAGRTDLADLRAAEALLDLGPATPRQRWLIARSLYRHARYRRALGLLQGLVDSGRPGVTLWKAQFLRGRCAFRLERWREAAALYRRARAAARRREDRAALLVHEARALELAGDIDAAAHRAREALRTRPTDERRLFWARLELERGRGESAATVVAHVRRTSARDRALILRAADARSRGDLRTASTLLTAVRGRTWRGSALVLAAGCALDAADTAGAASLLESAAGATLSSFWSLQALHLAQELPEDVRARWSRKLQTDLGSGPPGRRALVRRWAPLAADPADRAALRERVGRLLGLSGESATMAWRSPLACRLWEAGLTSEAARWDPRGFPGGTAFEEAWSARQFLLAGKPSWAIRTASAAVRRLGDGIPPDLLPLPLRQSLFPLPFPGPVAEAAARYGVPWPLLAAIVREESRWKPGALSAVGARGLTQLMPGTARRAAGLLGLPEPDPDDLFRPVVGLRLGAAELAALLRSFHGRAAPAVAAYNAGQAQARLWLGSPGQARGDMWYVAVIGFAATRSYTANVLAAQEAYRTVWPTIGDVAGGVRNAAEGPAWRHSEPPRAARESSPRGGSAPPGSTSRSPR